MTGYTLSPFAQIDLDEVLEWTLEHFGDPARLRYEALVIRAIQDVCADPKLAGSHSRMEIANDARTYHLTHSRNRVSKTVGRVKRARHFLLYRVRADGVVEIGRILHDSMELERHLPEDYQP